MQTSKIYEKGEGGWMFQQSQFYIENELKTAFYLWTSEIYSGIRKITLQHS